MDLLRFTARPPVCQRRRARRMAIWNGVLWAVGNGLASAALMRYWANQLDPTRSGLIVGLLAAVPQIVGLLQLGAPGIIARLDNRKGFCIGAFLLSLVPLAALPGLCAPGQLPSPGWSLAALIGLWSVHQLLQYAGMVALWSWLADAAAPRIRGRFLGWRQRWMMAGTAVALVLVGLTTYNEQDPRRGVHIEETAPAWPPWVSYAIVAGLGAAFLAAALAPLGAMPACERRRQSPRCDLAGPAGRLHHWLRPFGDRRFWPLLAFGCWFSFFNGITQSAQGCFPMNVLGVSLWVSLSLQTSTSLGQWAVSPWLGRLADRLGNRPVMIVCQLLASAGLIFYAIATPAQWWWLAGASTLWIAYAGLNLCLPNLTLRLAPREANAAYIAAFDAVRGLCYAASTILGGLLVHSFSAWSATLVGVSLSFFPCLFVGGWVVRSLGALLLLWVVEPAPSDSDA
jgi:MFS family permease